MKHKEKIPDNNFLTRWIFDPFNFIPQNQMLNLKSCFPLGDQKKGLRPVSVNWSKYLSETDKIHGAGNKKAEEHNKSSDNQHVYKGYLESSVKNIRDIDIGGHVKFSVDHAPENGNMAHAHISLLLSKGADKGLINHAKTELCDSFSKHVPFNK